LKFLFLHPGIYLYASGNSKAIGGSERQQWLFAKALVARGHKVLVYGFNKQCRDQEVIQGVIFKWFHNRHIVNAWAAILKNERIDWLYWRGADYYLGVITALAKLYHTKTVFACAFDLDCHPLKALTSRKYLWPFYAAGLLFVEKIFVQHKNQYLDLPKLLQSKARKVPNISNTVIKSGYRSNYIAWVGVLRQHKQPHLLVEIAEKLPEIKFVVCGPPSLHRTSKHYASTIVQKLKTCPNIDYRGQVSPDEAQEIINHATFLLSTSSMEGFPNTILQAWSNGVPVITLGLDPGGVITEHSLGFVGNSINELVSLFPTLLEDTTLVNHWSNNTQRYISKNHSETVVLDRFLKALEVV